MSTVTIYQTSRGTSNIAYLPLAFCNTSSSGSGRTMQLHIALPSTCHSIIMLRVLVRGNFVIQGGPNLFFHATYRITVASYT